MSLERLNTDGIAGEEVKVTVNDIWLFTLENFDWKGGQEKELLMGMGGKGLSFGRVRKGKTYELTFSIKSVNQALMEAPEDFRGNRGEVESFFLDGEEYTNLMDLRDLTITVRNPNQDGSKIVRRFKNFEFSEDGESYAVGDAVGRSCSGAAIDASGLI